MSTTQELKSKPSLKEEFRNGPEQEQKAPMSKEDTIKFYTENIPFMKLQDEYEEYIFKFNERKTRQLELQVREIEAVGYLSQWKAGQDEAKKRKENEDKMKADWDAMSPEEQEEWKQKAKKNLEDIEKQAAETSQSVN